MFKIRSFHFYVIVIIVAIYFAVNFFWLNLKIEMSTSEINVESTDEFPNTSIKIALVGDIHLPDTEKDYQILNTLLEDIDIENPDIIIFAGDYTSSPKKVDSMDKHRSRIVELLTKDQLNKKVFVLGNYESWSNPEAWIEEFKQRDATLLENEVYQFRLNDQTICIRGFGDYYTRKFTYIDFPDECNNKVKFSVTHDPAGAFDPRVEGLVLAGHTHCGQVRLPFYGALWVPTSAPKEATCGLYQDNQRIVFTTSGAGTTVFPVRVGTQSEWDMLKVSFQR